MITDIINRIRNEMTDIFTQVDNWFNVQPVLMDFTPANGGWTIRLILEHISLTNHYLLILIQKGVDGSLKKSKTIDYSDQLVNYDLDWQKLQQVGTHKSFAWHRPDHMEPTGNVSMAKLRTNLAKQQYQCMLYLDMLDKGQGVLHKTMMTVNDLGKIDVYHYIYFLAQHAKRHIAQMKQIKEEFVSAN